MKDVIVLCGGCTAAALRSRGCFLVIFPILFECCMFMYAAEQRTIPTFHSEC